MNTLDERIRRWRLVLGADEAEIGLSDQDRRLDQALAMLYGRAEDDEGGKRKGGLGGSAPKVARWLGDVREFFPSSVVQVLQRDAFERLGLKQMLFEPELLSAVEPDVHLVADLMSLSHAMPEKAKATARQVVPQVVADTMRRLESRLVQAVRGALDRSRRSNRPRHSEIDWDRTIRANLRHYQNDLKTVIPERLIGSARRGRMAQLDDVILCVDQSGSMAPSVVYASIFSSVLASIPALATRLVVFDTSIVDLTEQLADPVEVLFGVQLGGGTDINKALAYCETLVRRPESTHLLLISDLVEGGDAESMIGRVDRLVRAGVKVIVLLALADEGKPAYQAEHAARIAGFGVPVFGCTPDLFPELMAKALGKGDVAWWAGEVGLGVVRGV